MNTPKSNNPNVHVKFEKMEAGFTKKVNNFITGYMHGDENYLIKRSRRYILKDKIDKEARENREALLEELKIRDIVEAVLAEKAEAEIAGEEEGDTNG